MQRLAALCVLFLSIASCPHEALAQRILLDGTEPARQLSGLIHTLPDPDGEYNRDVIREKFRAGEMDLREQPFLDFGYTDTAHWIVLPFENTSSISVTYLLSSNWTLVDSMQAWVSLPGAEDLQIIDKRPNSNFSEINWSGVAVVSEQFLIPPLTEGEIFIRFDPFAFGNLPLSLETPASAFSLARIEAIGFAAFYGGISAAAIIFILFVIAIRHRGGWYFMGIIFSGLLIVTALDGFLFHYIWPNWPLWNRVAPFNMLALCNISSLALAAYMFKAANRNRLSKISWRMVAASLLPHLVWLAFGIFWAIPFGYFFLVLAMTALTYAIILWTQLLPRKRQIGFVASVLMLIIVGWILFHISTGIGSINVASHNLIKLLYVVMVLSSMVAYATHIAALNRNYAGSLKRELDLARNEAKMNADLLESERRFADAQELAARHKHRLATASHDLKQPIASLRLTLDAMAKSGGKEVEANVARAFDYLEDLVNENLQETRPDQTPDETDDETEVVSLDLLFETVVQMFNEEAISKGIRLNREDAAGEIRTRIVPLMRILNNLVSNSVKHTLTGEVTLSSEITAENAALVVRDTGPGMNEADIERFSTAYQKGDNSDGTGLGLPICFELARDLGMELTIQSAPGKGSVFRLDIPKAALV